MEISVVMACYNSNPTYLNQAIKSVLNQTFSDFELIIVDDGSECMIKDIIESKDNRIKIFKLENRVGLGAALNFGVSKSKGKFIARIDDDDLMKPIRLEAQYQFLKNHPEIVCVGTQIQMIYKNKAIKYRRFPTDTYNIIKDLINLKFSLAHTTVMYRKESFIQIGGYRVKGGGQDLDLFLQLSKIGGLSNLKESLSYYRLSRTGLSVNNPKKKEAYIFALEQFNNDTFKTHVQQSIKKLNRAKNTYSFKVYLIRRIHILNVSLFGKRLT